jgi:hypothetical protein
VPHEGGQKMSKAAKAAKAANDFSIPLVAALQSSLPI